jgi:hypothetical protein
MLKYRAGLLDFNFYKQEPRQPEEYLVLRLPLARRN